MAQGDRRGAADEVDTTWLARFASWAWAPFVAAAPGWTSYALGHRDTPALLRDNAELEPVALLHMVAGSLLVLGLWAWLAPRIGREQGCPTRREAWLEAVLRTRLLLLGPLVLALVHEPGGFLSATRPTLVLLGALLVAVSVRRWPPLPEAALAKLRRVFGGPRWPIAALVVGVGVIAMLLLRLALWRHHGFATRAFDLGIYDNIVWNTAHGDFLACTLIKSGVHTSAHFDPILAPIALIYALAPRAETLIVIQALWVLSGVIPAYLIAWRRLEDRLAATILGLGFALYPSVHGIVLFEFHSLALLAAPGLWMIWCLDEDRPVGYWIAFGLALLVREDASLFVAGIGVYALLGTDHRRRGGLTLGLALAYLAFVKFAVMPDPDLLMRDTGDHYSYTNRYRRLIPEGGGARDGIATLIMNPGFVLGHVLSTAKIMAALAFLVPLGLLPLAGGRRLLLAVYGAAFMFLASYKSIYYPLFHYSTALYPALFAATPEGVARVRGWLVERGETPGRARAAVLSYLGACLVLASLATGALLDVAPFALTRDSVRDFGPNERARYEWFRAAVAEIPPSASVSASKRTAPHLSNRAELYIVQQRIEADWLVVNFEDLEPQDMGWVVELERSGAYEEVAKYEAELWILRRSEP
ncbi:hypothetical protein ENSA5_16070 [Enhygromyxa salina]|uniref:DUF2079 domain-containing protein n=1 Tax=Enhygromyxa salina TaxID=215803 RepID=A0A2S9YEG3_9BACT|nr:DUF2079 domain-containing protein [Enhygromyxa salina]PRQ03401.1 hypothetical protein ENSA5_16070 [Enhygromyxa salina]